MKNKTVYIVSLFFMACWSIDYAWAVTKTDFIFAYSHEQVDDYEAKNGVSWIAHTTGFKENSYIGWMFHAEFVNSPAALIGGGLKIGRDYYFEASAGLGTNFFTLAPGLFFSFGVKLNERLYLVLPVFIVNNVFTTPMIGYRW